ncbi:hypothetical protein Bbelb_170000 [Branchiostoma belcheri]|nr:hypothetical protein Bbelb_170000 [Branchiostoma belcheri]
MGISDCRLKGSGTKKIHEDYVLAWSGVKAGQRAVHGVGVILHPDTAKNILSIENISERIVKIQVKEEQETTSIIQVYAPTEAYPIEEKENFFEKLDDSISSVPDTDNLVVMGDFNGRVGKRRSPWESYLGPHSDTTKKCSSNGEQLLALCAEHDLWIANTFFQHRESQTQTWYRWNNLAVSSQIDFVLTRRKHRKTVVDTRAIPNAELDTDHRPVILITRSKKQETYKHKKRTQTQTNLRQLQKEEVRQQVETEVTEKLTEIDNSTLTADETWNIFKQTLTEVLENTCGTKKVGKGKTKQTAWWSEDVKEAVQEKKRAFKEWMKSRKDEDYIKYRRARRHSKRVVREAKDQSWKQYGEHLTELCKQSIRQFYKSVKAMRVRDEPYDPTTIVNDKDGNPSHASTRSRIGGRSTLTNCSTRQTRKTHNTNSNKVTQM